MTNEKLIERLTDVAYDYGHDICYLAAERIEQLLYVIGSLERELEAIYEGET
jgi:hypothetical protein